MVRDNKGGLGLNQGLKRGISSAMKPFHYPERLDAISEGRMPAPIDVRFNPTNRCDEECFYCVYIPENSGIHPEFNPKGQLSREKVLETLDDFGDIDVKSVISSGGGEPLLPEYMPEALERTVDRGIGLSMITNGHRLSGKSAEILANAADWVRISADYCTPEQFQTIRKRPPSFFEQTERNMRDFAKSKRPDCNFGVNCVVHEHNYDRLVDIAHFLKETGLEYVRFSPLWCQGFEKYHAPFKEKALEQIEKAKDLKDKNFDVGSTYAGYFMANAAEVERPERCWWGQLVTVVEPEGENGGRVSACHNKSYDPSGKVGSITYQSFKEMWFSDKTLKFFESFNPQESCHHECSAHDRNVRLDEYFACSDPRVHRYP